eukprot:EG_transcript_32300
MQGEVARQNDTFAPLLEQLMRLPDGAVGVPHALHACQLARAEAAKELQAAQTHFAAAAEEKQRLAAARMLQNVQDVLAGLPQLGEAVGRFHRQVELDGEVDADHPLRVTGPAACRHAFLLGTDAERVAIQQAKLAAALLRPLATAVDWVPPVVDGIEHCIAAVDRLTPAADRSPALRAVRQPLQQLRARAT